MRPLPATVTDITPDWLNAALADAPNWPGGTIRSVTAEPIGGQASLASTVFRLTVEVDRSDGLCTTLDLIAKLHGPNASARADVFYATEAYFYKEVASYAGISVPETFIAEFDKQARRLVIVQEFLAGGRIGGAHPVLDTDDLERVLAALATLHVAWWASPAITRLSGVQTFDARRRSLIQFKPDDPKVHHFLDKFGNLLSPALIAGYRSMPGWLEKVEARLSTRVTLVHLDCTARNVFIPDDPRRDLVLYDWALFAIGNPALDLMTLLCQSLDPVEHGRLRDLVRIYHTMIVEKGVLDYGDGTLWDDFRLACLWRLAVPVALAMIGRAALDAHLRMIIPLLDSVVTHSGALDVLDRL